MYNIFVSSDRSFIFIPVLEFFLFSCPVIILTFPFFIYFLFQSVSNKKVKMSLSLYEKTAKDDEGSFTAEEKTYLDFYSSPLDKNGIRVALDKVFIFLGNTFFITFRLESINTSYYINLKQHNSSLPPLLIPF